MAPLVASPWARKFGAYSSKSNKSGFTPINLTFPKKPVDQDTKSESQRTKIEEFQKNALNDFTTQELIDLDAISIRKLKSQNLGDQIIPFLQRKNWYAGNTIGGKVPTTYTLYDIKQRPGTGGEGWVGTNATVWKLMRPSLLIATKMFDSNRVRSFIDLLISGERKSIHPKRLPPWTDDRPDPKGKNLLQSLHQGPISIEDQELKRKEVFTLLEKMWTLGFKNGNQDPFTKKPPKSGPTDAYTECDLDRKDCVLQIWNWLDYEYIQPLLDAESLDHSVRFGLQYWIATIIVHESMHAIWHIINMLNSYQNEGVYRPAPWEPFVGSEPLSEIGFSMERAAFGGVVHPMRKRKPFPSFGYWFDTEFPTTNDYDRRSPGSALLREPPPLSTEIYTFPVPIGIFEDTHQSEFWDVGIRKFGTPLLRFRGIPTGAVTQWKLKDANSTLFRKDFNLYPLEGELRDYAVNLSPQEREAGREALQWAERIVQMSRVIQSYWSFNNELKAQVETVSSTLNDAENLIKEINFYGPGSSRGQQAIRKALQLFMGQLKIFEESKETHISRFTNLHSMELQTQEFGGSEQQLSDSRRGLLVVTEHIWITARNFRQPFLEMLQFIDDDSSKELRSEIISRLDRIDLDLEICRLNISNPMEPRFETTKADKEIMIFIQASKIDAPSSAIRNLKNNAQINYKANDINDTLFFRSLLFFFAYLPTKDSDDIPDIMAKALLHQEILKSLAEGCSPVWKPYLNDALNFATQGIAKIGSPRRKPLDDLTPSWWIWDGEILFNWSK